MPGSFRGKPRPAELRAFPSAETSAEDFLFHLYRGSELLQDDRVHQAKEELEAALRLQPRDFKGQDLLAVVYFRLGLYPRAIEIYEELVRAFPKDASLRNNLALCYLKTGQSEKARSVLEELVMHQPDHVRAWAYLGLAYERLGDYRKAKEAFERGQAPGMARRMAERLSEGAVDLADLELGDEESPPEAFEEIEDREVTLSISQPPPPPIPSAPPLPIPSAPPLPRASVPPPSIRPPAFHEVTTANALAQSLELRIPDGAPLVVTKTGTLLVRLRESFAARLEAVRAVLTSSDKPRSEVLPRIWGVAKGDDSLGGPIAPLVLLHGSGQLVLGSRAEHRLAPFVLASEAICVRESALVGFDGALRYRNRELLGSEATPLPMVELDGEGAVVLEVADSLATMRIEAGQSAIVRRDALVGWMGRLTVEPLAPSEAPGRALGLFSLAGEGTVLIASRAGGWLP